MGLGHLGIISWHFVGLGIPPRIMNYALPNDNSSLPLKAICCFQPRQRQITNLCNLPCSSRPKYLTLHRYKNSLCDYFYIWWSWWDSNPRLLGLKKKLLPSQFSLVYSVCDKKKTKNAPLSSYTADVTEELNITAMNYLTPSHSLVMNRRSEKYCYLEAIAYAN